MLSSVDGIVHSETNDRIYGKYQKLLKFYIYVADAAGNICKKKMGVKVTIKCNAFFQDRTSTTSNQ